MKRTALWLLVAFSFATGPAARASDLLRFFSEETGMVGTAEVRQVLETPAAQLLLDGSDPIDFLVSLGKAGGAPSDADNQVLKYVASIKRVARLTDRVAFGLEEGEGFLVFKPLFVLEGKYDSRKIIEEAELLAENAGHAISTDHRQTLSIEDKFHIQFVSDTIILMSDNKEVLENAAKRAGDVEKKPLRGVIKLLKSSPEKHAVAVAFAKDPRELSNSAYGFVDFGTHIAATFFFQVPTDEEAATLVKESTESIKKAADEMSEFSISKSIRLAKVSSEGNKVRIEYKFPIRELAASVEQFLTRPKK